MINKRFLTCFSGLVLSASLMAQSGQHYFDMAVGGGLQSALFSLDNGETAPRFGWNLTGMYRYMFNDNWGGGVGLGLSRYKSTASFDSLRISQSFEAHEHNGLPYELENDFVGWKETQRILALEIPIALYFQKPIMDNWTFLGDVGAKLVIPVWNSYHVTDGYLSLKGFFEQQTNIEYSNLPEHGFSTYHHFYGDNDLKSALGAAFVDAGVLRKLKNNRQLYVGAYFSYAFTNLVESGGKPDLFENRAYSGILSSNRVDNAHLISAGVKVGITFGSNRDHNARDEDKLPSDEQQGFVVPTDDDTNALVQDHISKPLDVNPDRTDIRPVVEDVEPSLERVTPIDSDDIRTAQELKQMAENKIAEKQGEKVDDAKTADSPTQEDKVEKPAPISAAEAAERSRIQGNIDYLNSHLKISFSNGKAIVTPNAENERRLKVLTNYMKQHPNKILKITGHTCNLSNEDNNVIRAFMYAEAFKKYLQGKGISSMAIVTESMGSKQPVAPGDSNESCLKNRRVVISILHDVGAYFD